MPTTVLAPGLGAAASVPPCVAPVPMQAVRLSPSPYHDAMLANRAYMMRLEPDRLLHNYRAQAGLPPKGAVYGGWESETIAGHTLGHYLSALSLLHAQTGDAQAQRRVIYIVSELVLCQQQTRGQQQTPDGYVAGFTRSREGQVEPGRAVFAEIASGHIHSTGFGLNGAWSPLYNWHKLLAGLLDAHRFCGSGAAIGVCTGIAGYLGGVFDRLDVAQMQQVLACEYGGLNESLAELYLRTGDRRWLRLAERIYDRGTLDPLARGEDNLGNLHANTQIPKVIGLAHLHEITGRADYAVASRTFWSAVTEHHSYVIGGTGDREYFTEADTVANYVTEQTCETCATYNMLKLTRQLYAATPRSSFFDYYERAHLNHILAQQNPRTGMFAYMTPLMSGSSRIYSSPFDDFWCCVGTGMESHGKHGDSIYWHAGRDTLLVNLFIPSRLDWEGIKLSLETDYPNSGLITLGVAECARLLPWTLRLRIPAWSNRTTARLNGEFIPIRPDADGYLTLRRAWRPGDWVVLVLDMRLRLEYAPGSDALVSILRGPSVLAADLGPAATAFEGATPALVGMDVLAHVRPVQDGTGGWAVMCRPQGLPLRAFTRQHDRRSAVYFPVLTEAAWAAEQTLLKARKAQLLAIAADATDVFRAGEKHSEQSHGLLAESSYPVMYRGRSGRDARSGGFFSFRMHTRSIPIKLLATYWGEERDHRFRILVEGTEIALEQLDASRPGIFFDRAYDVPPALTASKNSILVRFEPLADHSAGPVFGVTCLPANTETTL
ncbi:glycoside hydrolase family 127 protein [Lichenicoccus sp.]|uniref:glycoside hydrolase family 127 protein n=1 Tax=Lichenicoccus sp. TaxID=2781899 RepID=UPI003D107B89